MESGAKQDRSAGVAPSPRKRLRDAMRYAQGLGPWGALGATIIYVAHRVRPTWFPALDNTSVLLLGGCLGSATAHVFKVLFDTLERMLRSCFQPIAFYARMCELRVLRKVGWMHERNFEEFSGFLLDGYFLGKSVLPSRLMAGKAEHTQGEREEEKP